MLIVIKLFAEDQSEFDSPELDSPTSSSSELQSCHAIMAAALINSHTFPLGGIFALRAHCALLLDYVPPEEPPSTPLGNALRIG